LDIEYYGADSISTTRISRSRTRITRRIAGIDDMEKDLSSHRAVRYISTSAGMNDELEPSVDMLTTHRASRHHNERRRVKTKNGPATLRLRNNFENSHIPHSLLHFRMASCLPLQAREVPCKDYICCGQSKYPCYVTATHIGHST
jgi:hypothetical protein